MSVAKQILKLTRRLAKKTEQARAWKHRARNFEARMWKARRRRDALAGMLEQETERADNLQKWLDTERFDHKQTREREKRLRQKAGAIIYRRVEDKVRSEPLPRTPPSDLWSGSTRGKPSVSVWDIVNNGQ